ncbi:MAG: class II aldolase/adducin family protein [Alphaproteobacteria bacterium]
MPGPDQQIEARLRQAARALGRHGLAHAYGHCSIRLDAESFLVCAPRPMGLIRPGENGTVVSLSGPLPEGVLGEVRVHREIYRRRPGIGGICRSMPPHVMSLSVLQRTPRPRHGFGTYFAPAPALWDDPQLLRDDAAAERLAKTLGEGAAVMMRGNGCVVAGETLEEAVVLTWYLEDAARVELDVLKAGMSESAPVLSAEDALKRATRDGRIIERMWDYLVAGDPETRDETL